MTPKLFRPQVQQVVEYWRETLHPRAKPSEAREAKVRGRLREGYSVEELKAAIDGCAGSDFHRHGHYTDLALICRDAPHVDRFMAMANGRPARRPFDEVWAELMGWVHLHGAWATSEEKRTLSAEAAGLVRWAGGFSEVARWETRDHPAIRAQARRAYEAGVR